MRPEKPKLLSDKQVKDFLINGYLILKVYLIKIPHSLLKTQLPESEHKSIYKDTLSLLKTRGNPGNNILPLIPKLQHV